MVEAAADALTRMGEQRLVAVVRVRGPELLEPTVAALVEGGVMAIELTFTTPGLGPELARTRERHPSVLLGAGTIREPEHARIAAGAGADFLVTPHLDRGLLDACLGTGMATLPGVFTPSEVAAALAAGAQAVKLFPAGTAGPAHLRALRGPFPGLRVVPTGGIGLADLAPWLDAGAHAVGVGGELCSTELIENERFDELALNARRFREALP
jgi:2-dehydro-3-deoxyphosphogluconate aldolase/(4S)-4-hydroxy-2-oxoglutarate aldolase